MGFQDEMTNSTRGGRRSQLALCRLPKADFVVGARAIFFPIPSPSSTSIESATKRRIKEIDSRGRAAKEGILL